MDVDYVHRFWTDLFGRSEGPMQFRFVLQPVMAMLMALRDGIGDARKGRDPYGMFMHESTRPVRLAAWREGVTATARILLLGVAMDVIYQFKVFGGFRHPWETVNIAIILGFLPYLLLRGPVARIARRWIKPPSQRGSE